MLTPQRILFPTDHSACAERAFAHATFLAAESAAERPVELHVFHADVPVDALDDEPPAPPLTLPTSDGIRVIEAEERGESVHEVILDYAKRHAIDLVVMGTHGRRGLAHAFLGSVAERIVREARCAVLTVGPGTAAPGAIRRILAPTDFSDNAAEAVRVAGALAISYQAAVDLLHIISAPVLPDVYGLGLLWTDIVPDVVQRSQEALELLAERALGHYAGAVRAKVGVPADAIIRAAADADLVVMATHGLTGLKRFALGSVTERVVQHAPCPVFTVRHADVLLPAFAFAS